MDPVNGLRLVTVLLLLQMPCFAQKSKAGWPLIDNQATTETKNLYRNLQQVAKKGVLFGHQDALASGINWKNEADRSDLKELVGEYPAVIGWDLGKMEIGDKQSFDDVPFKELPGYIKQVYQMGGVNTLSWHCNNPVNPVEGVRYKTVDSTIKKMFADPGALTRYQLWLDTIARFAGSLKGPHGELIPLIFRPFHEHTGNWFWWGKSHCTADEYKMLWRFTVDYLKNKKQVHNIIYAYATDAFYSREEYLERYPGDNYVDILGFDYYDKTESLSGTKYQTNLRKMIEILSGIAAEKKKVSAFTEAGMKLTPRRDWWTNALLQAIKGSGLSYVLVWRNGNIQSYWGTFKGQESAENFEQFYRDESVFFQKKAAAYKLYQ